MTWIRLAVALVFAGLYAALMVRVLVTGADDAIAATTPIAGMAVAYLLGDAAFRYIRRGKDEGPPAE